MGEYEKAYDYMKKAIEVLHKVLPYSHPNLVSSQMSLKVIEKKLNS